MTKRAETRRAAESPARRALAFRQAFLESVTPEDVKAIGSTLLELAKAGNLSAAKLVLDRVLGSAAVADWDASATVERKAMLDDLLG